MLTLGAVCQQGSPTESRGASGRIVSFMLFVLVIFLYTSYSANIVALLQSSTSSIRTLSDLLHSRLDVGVHDMVYNRHYFKIASDPVRSALYRKKVAPPGAKDRFMALEEGIERVRLGLFAFHSELSSGYNVIQRTFREDEKCGLQTIPFLQVVDPYLALRKNSAYKELFRVVFVSVGTIECYPALLVLAYGAGLALAALGAERLLRRRCDAPQRSETQCDDLVGARDLKRRGNAQKARSSDKQ
ncbi:Ionotropic receptor 75a [Gryllus bimaculatus]|nr:Ionotropic receptor 75a [Gryllus bimaculatus]